MSHEEVQDYSNTPIINCSIHSCLIVTIKVSGYSLTGSIPCALIILKYVAQINIFGVKARGSLLRRHPVCVTHFCMVRPYAHGSPSLSRTYNHTEWTEPFQENTIQTILFEIWHFTIRRLFWQ
jgi:hypothetical protein